MAYDAQEADHDHRWHRRPRPPGRRSHGAVVLVRNANLASCIVGSWKATSNVTTLTEDGRVTVNTITGLRL